MKKANKKRNKKSCIESTKVDQTPGYTRQTEKLPREEKAEHTVEQHHVRLRDQQPGGLGGGPGAQRAVLHGGGAVQQGRGAGRQDTGHLKGGLP